MSNNTDFKGSKVIFIEPSDFQGKHLVYNGAPVKGMWIVMVQKTDCGYCVQSKPDFRNLGNLNTFAMGKGVTFATIQLEGQDRDLFRTIFNNIGVEITGVPTYIVFNNGEYAGSHAGGMTEAQLRKQFGF